MVEDQAADKCATPLFNRIYAPRTHLSLFISYQYHKTNLSVEEHVNRVFQIINLK